MDPIDSVVISGSQLKHYKLYKRRWWILFIFSWLSFQQSMIWLTFSPIAQETQDMFHVTTFFINLLLAYGCIFYIPFVFITSWILEKENGLRKCVLIAAALDMIAGVSRCFTLIEPTHWSSVYILSFAHILNAIVGPLLIATPSLLSAYWFGENERTKATAIGFVSNNLGSAVGFLLAPYCVQFFSIQVLIYFEAAHSVIVGLLIFAYFPQRPPTPPSASAEKELASNAHSKRTIRDLGRDIWTCCKNPSFIVLIIIGGSQSGIFNSWSGDFNILLLPYGFSDIDAGYLGFAATLSGQLGGFLAGVLGDTLFKKKFKLLLFILFICASLSCLWFSVGLPNMIFDYALLPMPKLLLAVPPTLAGFFLGSTNPIFYELGAELTFPVSEGISATLLTFLTNVFGLVLLLVAPFLPVAWDNSVMTFTVIICTLLLFFVRETYKRSTASSNSSIQESTSLLTSY